MNCRRFNKLIFEHAEGSLSPRAQAAAERHLASCATCRELARQHRECARLLAEGFLRETERIAFAGEEQRRLVAALQQQPVQVHETHLLSDWWRRVAWIGASAAVLIGLFLMAGFPFRDRPAVPASSAADISDAPILVRFSYCAPTYTFWREDDLVIDSLSCTPMFIEHTLWNQKAASTKSGNQSRL